MQCAWNANTELQLKLVVKTETIIWIDSKASFRSLITILALRNCVNELSRKTWYTRVYVKSVIWGTALTICCKSTVTSKPRTVTIFAYVICAIVLVQWTVETLVWLQLYETWATQTIIVRSEASHASIVTILALNRRIYELILRTCYCFTLVSWL